MLVKSPATSSFDKTNFRRDRLCRAVIFVGGTAIFDRMLSSSQDESAPLRFFGRAEPLPPFFWDRRSRSLRGRSVVFARRSRFPSAVADSYYRRRVCFVAALYERRGDSSDRRSPSLRHDLISGWIVILFRTFCAISSKT
jgi:hypothetical protein